MWKSARIRQPHKVNGPPARAGLARADGDARDGAVPASPPWARRFLQSGGEARTASSPGREGYTPAELPRHKQGKRLSPQPRPCRATRQNRRTSHNKTGTLALSTFLSYDQNEDETPEAAAETEKNGLTPFMARQQGSCAGCLHSKKRHVDQKLLKVFQRRIWSTSVCRFFPFRLGRRCQGLSSLHFFLFLPSAVSSQMNKVVCYLGKISCSKIAVGIEMVQQAFGMSTMPPILPSTGAVPSSIYACSPVKPFVFKYSMAFRQARR